jgi:hypothetical protein
MTLSDVNDELAARLPTFKGGGWNDLSIERGGNVILRLGRGTPEAPGVVTYESNMNEHSMTVEQVLNIFAAGNNGIRLIKQYTTAG